MKCAALLESAESRLLAGNLSQTDFTSQIHTCLPQACTEIYGSANIDLAGTGVYYSTLIEVALFVLCGPLQALVSRCLSKHASTSAYLSLARFQSVLDTTYSTGTLFGIGITVAGLMRTSLYPIAALERSLIRDMSDLQSMLQNFAMAIYIIMKTPPQIDRGSRSWSPIGVYFGCQGINTATWFLKRRVNEILPVKILTRLCSEQVEAEQSYPDLNMAEASSYNPFITGAVLGLGIAAVGIAISIYLPKVWKLIEKIFESRVLQALIAFIWVAGCLACTGYWTYHLTYTRDGLEGTPVWDVGQVFVVVIWLPAVVQFFMTILMTLTPGKDTQG